MTFPEKQVQNWIRKIKKQNWLEKRIVYSRTVESTSEQPTSPIQSPKQEEGEEKEEESKVNEEQYFEFFWIYFYFFKIAIS